MPFALRGPDPALWTVIVRIEQTFKAIQVDPADSTRKIEMGQANNDKGAYA